MFIEQVEVFTPTPNELYLEMSDERFIKTYELLQANLEFAIEDGAIDLSNLQTISLGSKLSEVTSSNRANDTVALLGCGVVLFAFLYIFMVGLFTILGWN